MSELSRLDLLNEIDQTLNALRTVNHLIGNFSNTGVVDTNGIYYLLGMVIDKHETLVNQLANNH